MAGNSDKNWNRPWSTDEIIQNADNWSLAGDVALLNSIKSFADNLLTKTVSISDNVNQMLNNLNEVGLQLDIAQNNFQSLRHRQFIESRVYEDDETADIVEEVTSEVKENADQEKLLVKHLKSDLNVLDKYFNKVEVSISDSEEESGDISYVLQVKDLYADRPLPLIIGSEEWYKKRHVGLEDSSSESETDKVSEIYSDSDSADDLPKDLLKGSETSSELDLSSQTSESRPVANSTFNDSIKRPYIAASEDESDEQGSVPVKAPISNKSFAEQLAAKLGNVVSEREDVSTEVNRQPIQPAHKFTGDLFFDEPPPLDDIDDTMFPKSAKSGLFSGGEGLFDGNEELFWGQQSQAVSKVKPEDKSAVDKQENVSSIRHVNKPVTTLPKLSKISKGLFDSGSESSDEDIFAVSRKQISKQPFLQPFKSTAPLFDEEPPALDGDKTPVQEVKKKPVGGVSIFGNHSILSNPILKKQDSVGSKDVQENEQTVKNKKISLFDDEIDTDVATSSKVPEPAVPKPKKISLFDDDDDLFKDDLFSNITSKTVSGLFDDIGKDSESLFASNVSNNTPKPDLFSNVQEPSGTSEVKTKKKVSLFDDIDKDKIFTQKTKETDEKTAQVKTADVVAKNSVNTDVEKEILWKRGESGISSEASVNEDQRSVQGEILAGVPQGQVIGTEKKLNRGLFAEDDDESDGDDFFKNIIVNKPFSKVGLFQEALNTGLEKNDPAITPEPILKPEPPQLQITEATPQASDAKSALNLFGSSPPPVDDDWDTKSDNFSDNDDQFSYRVGENTVGSSMFDNEPPSLGPNESSGIVRDQNITRIDTDDSSFYPYASSSRRLSSDLFNEQQSQDSFFITKSKDPSNAIPNLDIIPEVTKSSILDITPSGNPEDFEQSDDKSPSLNDTSVFQGDAEIAPASARKRISLFDDDYGQISNTEDLFSIKSSPKKSMTMADNAPEEQVQEPERPKPTAGSPGKLKHNLKINVRALMPGYAPPKLKDLSKSQSLDLPNDPSITAAAISTPDMSLSTTDITENTPNANLEKAASFEHTLNTNVEVLHSVTKDRARIPIKRRPSTRRGRQQAILRTSAAADNIQDESLGVDGKTKEGQQQRETEQTKTDLKTPSFETETSSQPRISNAGGISDDDGDLFSNLLASEGKDNSLFDNTSKLDALKREEINSETIQQKLEIDFPKKNVPISSKESAMANVDVKKDDIFRQDTGSFLETSGKGDKVARVEKSKSSIFDLDDSDEDLFGPSELKKSKTETKSRNMSGKVGKKSLFGDSDSDEDLFSESGSSNNRRKGMAVRPVEKKTPKTQTLLKKLENIEADDDPLSSLLK